MDLKNELREIYKMPPEARPKALMILTGKLLGLFSKSLLEENGFVCDYKINGEKIEDIEKLKSIDIKQKIQLAIKEERYEDCVSLKKILDNKKINQ